MQFKKASLSLLLPLLIAACDSSQPNYSASNANVAPPPAAEPPVAQPAPPPPVAAPVPAAPQVAAAPAMAPATPPMPTWRDKKGAERWTNPSQAGSLGPAAKIGVGNCDDYVERYRACINNTETMTREQSGPLRRTLAEQLRKWKADADAGKISQVAASCTAADRTARESFQKAGCTTF